MSRLELEENERYEGIAADEDITAGTVSAWPSQRQLLLLKLWATIFQASDRRHPVITPASLIVGACLTLSPVPSREALLAGKQHLLTETKAGPISNQYRSSMSIENLSST